MIELKGIKVDNVLTRTVEVFPIVPPVEHVLYTRDQEMFIDRVVMEFRKRNDEPWQVWSVYASGDRRNKDGSRGKETKVNRYSSYTEKPTWLTEIVNFFTPED
jgi:hypothetical protein